MAQGALVKAPFVAAEAVARLIEAAADLGVWVKGGAVIPGGHHEGAAVESKLGEEVEQLASAAPWPRSILYRLAFATLARRSALIALTVDDLVISLKGGATILLRPEEAKTKQGQQVPVPQRLLKDLKRLAKESETGRLFEKVMRNNFSLTFDADLLAAKIPKNTTDGIASFHSLRHGGTTHLIRSGVPMVLVQRMGGWQSINILAKHYSHLTPVSDREQIDRAMSPQTKKSEKS